MKNTPPGWTLTRIGQVCEVVRGASPRPAGAPRYFDGDYLPWITVAEVTSAYGMHLDKTKSFLTEEGAKFTRTIPPDTLILTNSGATLGVPKITKIKAGANDGIAVLLNPKGVTNEYLYFVLESRTDYFRNHLAPGNGQPNLNTDLIKEESLLLPPVSEQSRITNLGMLWDKSIQNTERLIAAKERFHRWLQQRLIEQRAARHHWETQELGGLIRERSERSIQHDEYPVLTSSRRGLFLQSEYFSKQVTSEDNTGYKIMRRGDFTFRSMSDDGRFVFNRLEKYDTGIISPAYGVFYAEGVCPEFLAHYLNSSYFAQLLARETQGGTRKALRFSALAGMEVDLPKRADQERIAAILDDSRHEIDLLRTQLETLRHQKRGLMQKLLTGRWRVPVHEEATA